MRRSAAGCAALRVAAATPEIRAASWFRGVQRAAAALCSISSPTCRASCRLPSRRASASHVAGSVGLTHAFAAASAPRGNAPWRAYSAWRKTSLPYLAHTALAPRLLPLHRIISHAGSLGRYDGRAVLCGLSGSSSVGVRSGGCPRTCSSLLCLSRWRRRRQRLASQRISSRTRVRKKRCVTLRAGHRRHQGCCMRAALLRVPRLRLCHAVCVHHVCACAVFGCIALRGSRVVSSHLPWHLSFRASFSHRCLSRCALRAATNAQLAASATCSRCCCTLTSFITLSGKGCAGTLATPLLHGILPRRAHLPAAASFAAFAHCTRSLQRQHITPYRV